MDNDGIPLNGPEVNLNNVASLNHSRSVSFMNGFLINTVHFLNNFSGVSEKHMAEQLLEMQKLEVAINILEAKLNSVPALNDFAAPAKPEAESTPTQAVSPSAPVEKVKKEEELEAANQVPVSSVPDANMIPVKNDPQYARFFKMITVGVPKAAIEGKMRLEGLDPSLLDTPDAPVPDASVPDVSSDDSDNESESLSDDDDWD